MPDTVSQFAKGYEDYLQCPLQPLMDNLESQTYEIFEKDPIKYSQYQKVWKCFTLGKQIHLKGSALFLQMEKFLQTEVVSLVLETIQK